MPRLSEISYSHEAAVAAITDYFDFLAKMYLDESAIFRPPEGGWPEITPDRLSDLGKTDEVIMLLRHIPYLRGGMAEQWKSEAEAGPSGVRFYHWLDDARDLDRPDLPDRLKDAKYMTEPIEYMEQGLIPPHVVGLISTKQDLWLLDTQLGVVYWYTCPFWISFQPTRERIQDDPFEYAPEDQSDWRNEPAWAIADFFEMLKDSFRRLSSIPLSPTLVLDPEGVTDDPQVQEGLSLAQAVYREHGWPDLDRYGKEECLKAVRERLQERYGEDSWTLGFY
jgi:hypothetical protein